MSSEEKEKEIESSVEAMDEDKEENVKEETDVKTEEPEKVEPKAEEAVILEKEKEEPLPDAPAVEEPSSSTKEEPEVKSEEADEAKEEEKMETDESEEKKEEEDDPEVHTKPNNDTTEGDMEVEGEENTETDNEEESDLKNLYPENYQNAASSSRRLRINFRPVSDHDNERENDESENEYKSDDNEIKKTIMVGSDYQAQIPEEFSKYDDALPYENKDKLVWDGCDKLSEDEILDYLRKVRVISHASASDNSVVTAQLLVIPTGKHLRDDEQALFLLQQCGHDMEEALRRRKIAAAPPEEVMSAWSEEECRNFETGLRLYGKNFHQIQLSKVKTRSVGEIVQFYYLWKKSERHDVFASKARLDKKKYSLNPGQCIMDRFLEDQDGTGNAAAAAAASQNSNQETNDVPQAIPRNLSMPMCV